MLSTTSLARILKWVCSVVLVALPLAVLAYVLHARPTPANAAEIYTDVTILAAPPAWAFFTANAFSVVSLLILVSLVFYMRKLFDHYAGGRILTFDTAKVLQRIGQFLCAVAVLRLISHPLLSFLLTSGHPEEQRQISVTMTDGDLGFLIASGFVFLVGKAMYEAAQNAEDIKGFV